MFISTTGMDAIARAEALKPALYAKLREYGYQPAEQLRTPGYIDGVMCDGVEISGVPLPQGLRIDISVPVDAREDSFFQRVSCAGRTYLSAREMLYAHPLDLDAVVQRAIEIAERGKGIFSFNQDKAI